MLFLHFQIGDDAFALAADRIVEILPLVELKKERHAPEEVAGSFDYRGRFTPVIDLCVLELGRPARRRMSTRIVMVRLPEDEGPKEEDPREEDIVIGLIAENATETLRLNPADFAPFATGPRGLVQCADLESLLPAQLRAFARGEMMDSQ